MALKRPLAGGAPSDETALNRPLAGGAPSDETVELEVAGIAMNGVAPEPLAVVATAGMPKLALLVESDMIWS
jgi:hypothetical protein